MNFAEFLRTLYGTFPVTTSAALFKHLRRSLPENRKRLKLLEAVVQRRSVKKVFLEILQNSQENTCAMSLF